MFIYGTGFTARATDINHRKRRHARLEEVGALPREQVFEAVSPILTRTFPWLSMSPPCLNPSSEAFMYSDIFSLSPSDLQAPARQMLACETPRISPTTAAHRRYLDGYCPQEFKTPARGGEGCESRYCFPSTSCFEGKGSVAPVTDERPTMKSFHQIFLSRHCIQDDGVNQILRNDVAIAPCRSSCHTLSKRHRR